MIIFLEPSPDLALFLTQINSKVDRIAGVVAQAEERPAQLAAQLRIAAPTPSLAAGECVNCAGDADYYGKVPGSMKWHPWGD